MKGSWGRRGEGTINSEWSHVYMVCHVLSLSVIISICGCAQLLRKAKDPRMSASSKARRVFTRDVIEKETRRKRESWARSRDLADSLRSNASDVSEAER